MHVRHLRDSIAVAALFIAPLFTQSGCAKTTPHGFASDSPGNAALQSIPKRPHAALCPTAKAGAARCFAHVVTDEAGQVVVDAAPQGFGPPDLASAYALPLSGGAGKTVALVDANDDPYAESDSATYRAQYGLPPCTTANGCFKKVNQQGQQSNYPAASSDWAGEISRSTSRWSAPSARRCKILLVEANSADMSDLGASVNMAAQLGASAISNSYGGGEDSSVTSESEQYFNHPGVLITASSGDGAYGVNYPASSQYVVGVGGTSLVQSTTAARGWVEGAWSDAGSGCSAFSPKPSWQTDTGCGQRTVADVSAVANPNTGLAVYSTYDGGWIVLGGTSASSPIVAATFALTGQTGQTAEYLYAHPDFLFDVTSGNNGNCGSYLCNAGPGYDGPTGLGTPNATLWAGGGSGSSSGGSGSSSGGGSGSSSGGTTPDAGAGAGDGGGSGGSSSGGGGGSGPQSRSTRPTTARASPATRPSSWSRTSRRALASATCSSTGSNRRAPSSSTATRRPRA